jgi:hypothetical protein
MRLLLNALRASVVESRASHDHEEETGAGRGELLLLLSVIGLYLVALRTARWSIGSRKVPHRLIMYKLILTEDGEDEVVLAEERV